MKYIKKLNMVCFNLLELKTLYKTDKVIKILIEANKTRCNIVNSSKEQSKKIVDSVVKGDLKQKEEIEIFSALSLCALFFENDSFIGFVLKDGYDVGKNPIQTLEGLKKAAKEDTLTDFAIITKSGMREFQLKQFYRQKLETEDLFNFIKEKIEHYGGNFGTTALLFSVRGDGIGPCQSNISFKEIHERLCKLNLDRNGLILIWYNDGNKKQVIIEVYPDLSACQKETGIHDQTKNTLYN
ncbi:MAG: hypothetical protein V1858_02835 [Candidatus Gottesmanbacteria bacterium]